jgi:hypothetical protein
MAIMIKLPLKLSNKAKTLSDVSETNSDKHNAPVPFIDRLTVVYTPQSVNEAHDLYKSVYLYLDDSTMLFPAPKGSNGGFGSAKKIVIDSLVDMKHWPLLQWSRDHGQPLLKRLRLEFVPKDLGAEGILDLKIKLQALGLDWSSLLKFGNVSRIDVAVDFPDLSMNHLRYLPKQATKITHWYGKGQLETIISGLSSGNQTVIYDRGKKREAINQYGFSGVRIERRLKNTKKKLAGIIALLNPFAGISLIQALPTTAPTKTSDGNWAMFSDSVRVRGLENALLLLSVKDRTNYRAHISANKSPHWKPDDIWQKWHQSLADIELLTPLS